MHSFDLKKKINTIMKKHFYSMLTGTVLFSILHLNIQAQSFTEKIVLGPGKTIKMFSIDSSDLVQKQGEDEMPMKTISESVTEIKLMPNSTENINLLTTLQKIKIHFEGYGQKMDYDSENPAKQEGMMAANIKELIGKTDSLICDANGKIMEAEEKEKPKGKGRGMMRRMQQGPNFENAFLLIPKEAKVGSGWKADKEKEGIRTQTIYFLDKIEGNIASVSFKRKSKGTSSIEIQGMQSTNEVDNLSDGLITVDITTGLVQTFEETLKTNSKMNMMGKEIPSTGVTVTKVRFE